MLIPGVCEIVTSCSHLRGQADDDLVILGSLFVHLALFPPPLSVMSMLSTYSVPDGQNSYLTIPLGFAFLYACLHLVQRKVPGLKSPGKVRLTSLKHQAQTIVVTKKRMACTTVLKAAVCRTGTCGSPVSMLHRIPLS